MSNCTSDDSANEGTESTSNESPASISPATISSASISSASISPKSNTSQDEHEINCDIGEIKGFLDRVKTCLNRIKTRVYRISLRESADDLKYLEMENVMTLIDGTDDLTDCTMRSASRISRAT